MATAEPYMAYLAEPAGRAPTAPRNTSYDALDLAAFAYLALPVLIFLVGWLRWWVGVPLAFLLLAGLYRLLPAGGTWAPSPVRWRVALVIIVIALAWSALGGAGHLFYANFDWTVRDTVLRDLVIGAWPVGYGTVDGLPLLLRAPIGYYLPAAVLGKACGLSIADPMLLAWTALGTILFLGLAVSRVTGWRAVLITTTIGVFFSGMDLLGTALRGGWFLTTQLQWTDHLEWWAQRFQYSSHTTQLFWVPNHALPGWIATALLLKHVDRPRFVGALPLLVGLLPLWSPLAALGFLPLAGAWWVRQLFVQRAFTNIDWVAMVAGLVIALVTGLYLVLNAETIRFGMTYWAGESMVQFIPHYLQFVLLEVGILWLLLLAVRADLLLVVAGLILCVLPLAAFGPANDLAMRASIPSLLVIALNAAAALSNPGRAMQRKVFWPILVVLMLGVPTASTEIARSVSAPGWQPDYTNSLVPDPTRKDYPPHYATLLSGTAVAKIMRPIQNVNATHQRPAKAGGASHQ